MRRSVALALLAGCGGCAGAPHPPPLQASAPAFDPVAFFNGQTQGRGRLSILLHGPQTVAVEGHGRIERDGSIVLDQTVRRAGKAATRRTWRLRRVGVDRYAGTLSDAVGPVHGEVHGSRLHLAFAMKGGLHAEQWLDLQPGGREAHNRMVVRKFGVTVARLDETITRRDAG